MTKLIYWPYIAFLALRYANLSLECKRRNMSRFKSDVVLYRFCQLRKNKCKLFLIRKPLRLFTPREGWLLIARVCYEDMKMSPDFPVQTCYS